MWCTSSSICGARPLMLSTAHSLVMYWCCTSWSSCHTDVLLADGNPRCTEMPQGRNPRMRIGEKILYSCDFTYSARITPIMIFKDGLGLVVPHTEVSNTTLARPRRSRPHRPLDALSPPPPSAPPSLRPPPLSPILTPLFFSVTIVVKKL